MANTSAVLQGIGPGKGGGHYWGKKARAVSVREMRGKMGKRELLTSGARRTGMCKGTRKKRGKKEDR